MIIHPEADNCISKINDYDLLGAAAECFQWQKFIPDPAMRKGMLEEEAIYGLKCTDIFRCPGCHHEFNQLSALFMHVESPAYEQTLQEGAIRKLRKWLANRLY